MRWVGIDVRNNPAASGQGLVLAQFTGIIPIDAVSSTLVADRNGVIRGRVVGRVDGTTLRGLIQDAERIT